MRKPGIYGSNFEIFAISQLLQKHIKIFQGTLEISVNNPLIIYTAFIEDSDACVVENDPIMVFYDRNDLHYQAVVKTTLIPSENQLNEEEIKIVEAAG